MFCIKVFQENIYVDIENRSTDVCVTVFVLVDTSVTSSEISLFKHRLMFYGSKCSKPIQQLSKME